VATVKYCVRLYAVTVQVWPIEHDLHNVVLSEMSCYLSTFYVMAQFYLVRKPYIVSLNRLQMRECLHSAILLNDK
jgi:hypothetical protein